MDYDKKLIQLGIELPAPPAPVGSYVPVQYEQGLAYLSGQISKSGNQILSGKLGRDLTIPQGQAAARAAALNVLGIIKHMITFPRFKKIIKLVGYVNVTEDFKDHSQVVNGASDFFLDFFGESGKHARSSIGVASLPLGAAVEVEVILALNS